MATAYEYGAEVHSAVPQYRDSSFRSTLLVAVRFTLITTILLGVLYPLTITGVAQLTMADKANGQLIVQNGKVLGSAILGQNFTSPRYFHPRPSAAGTGYDAANSGGSNLAPSNRALITRVEAEIAAWRQRNPQASGSVPVELVTTSASGLDPDISPDAAYYQVPMVAAARHLPESAVRALVAEHIDGRQLGLLGEPRVNVLQLNLALDRLGNKTRH